jgi:hypothetical protein
MKMGTFKYGLADQERLCKVNKASVVEDDGKYYLSLEYEIEDLDRRVKYTVPRIDLNIDFKHNMPSIDNYNCRSISDPNGYRFNCGSYNYPIAPVKNPGLTEYEYAYKTETLKEKARKLTISEIEKKLGYKVEIVAEKEDKK